MFNFNSSLDQLEELDDIIAEQEKMRKKQLTRLIVSILLVICAVAVAGYLQCTRYPDLILIGPTILVGLPFLMYTNWDVKHKVRQYYKKHLVCKLLGLASKAVGNSSANGIRYKPEFDSGMDRFNTNPLFESGNFLNTKDLFEGNINGRDFKLYEAMYYYETSYGKFRFRSDRFKGLVFIVDCGCGSHAAAAITNGGLQGVKGIVFHRVNVGNTPLANTFCVYSTDVAWAQQLLPMSMQDRIMNLSFQTKDFRTGQLKILFRKNNMEVYLPSKQVHFQPKLIRKITRERVETDYMVLETLLRLV